MAFLDGLHNHLEDLARQVRELDFARGRLPPWLLGFGWRQRLDVDGEPGVELGFFETDGAAVPRRRRRRQRR